LSVSVSTQNAPHSLSEAPHDPLQLPAVQTSSESQLVPHPPQ
jgi:hypothetical protein